MVTLRMYAFGGRSVIIVSDIQAGVNSVCLASVVSSTAWIYPAQFSYDRYSDALPSAWKHPV